MGLHKQEREANSRISARSSLMPKVSAQTRILTVCDDDSITERLQTALQAAGLTSECARTMTAGCSLARSGQFQVIFTTAVLGDGSWRRLADIASQYDLGFAIVLVARNPDSNQRAQALEDGAFDVLDILHELPRTTEATTSALWAAYLKGAGLCLEMIGHPMAA